MREIHCTINIFEYACKDINIYFNTFNSFFIVILDSVRFFFVLNIKYRKY